MLIYRLLYVYCATLKNPISVNYLFNLNLNLFAGTKEFYSDSIGLTEKIRDAIKDKESIEMGSKPENNENESSKSSERNEKSNSKKESKKKVKDEKSKDGNEKVSSTSASSTEKSETETDDDVKKERKKI